MAIFTGPPVWDVERVVDDTTGHAVIFSVGSVDTHGIPVTLVIFVLEYLLPQVVHELSGGGPNDPSLFDLYAMDVDY